MYITLYADGEGNLLDFPGIHLLGRSGSQWLEPDNREMIPLPGGATLVTLPGYLPVGLDQQGEIFLIDQVEGQPGSSPNAVAALLPQGFTRTMLPAAVRRDENAPLPLYGYAAVGFKNNKIFVAAVQSDEHRKWHPKNYNTSGLPAKIDRLRKKYPRNRILEQLARCSLEYGCYTAQNIFYQRWEGGIPSMIACNADCLGCISENHGPFASPQNRLLFLPEADEIAQIGQEHLENAREAIISFGQGCEGEPSLNAAKLSRAIKMIRSQTGKGTINMNTNAGYTRGIKQMCDAGLESMRVTIFSCREENYLRYHRPKDYSLADVIGSIRYAGDKGLNVSLNLLVFPGFSDREAEIEALLEFVRQNPINMIQLRNLNIDADYLMQNIGGDSLGIGMDNYIQVMRREIPLVRLGSYSHPQAGTE
jgi:pyruvate-formate lyase-activating enzyme